MRDERPWAGATPPAALFRYSPDRKGHLAGFRGTLQADGYAGFRALHEGGAVREAACWAHVRRKFYELVEATGEPAAREALARITELYAIGAAIRGRPPSERAAARRARAGAQLDA